MRLGLYLRSASDHASRAEYSSLAHKAATLLWSESAGVVILKDLTSDPDAAKDMHEPRIRPASLEDVRAILDPDRRTDLDADDLWERRLRRHVAATIGVDGCFVADVEGVGPSFMQYLFTAQDNQRLRSSFDGLFPALGGDEAMVEFLYVAPESRNPGFAVSCLLEVAAEARNRGASTVISFIDPANKGALFVNHLAGFRAQSVRRRKWRFFRGTSSYEDWPVGTSRALIDLASGRAAIP